MKVMAEWFESWTEYQNFQISQAGAAEIMEGIHDLKETELD